MQWKSTYLFNSYAVGRIYVTRSHRRIFRRLPFKREREKNENNCNLLRCGIFFTIRSRLPMNGVTWSRVDQSDIFRQWSIFTQRFLHVCAVRASASILWWVRWMSEIRAHLELRHTCVKKSTWPCLRSQKRSKSGAVIHAIQPGLMVKNCYINLKTTSCW